MQVNAVCSIHSNTRGRGISSHRHGEESQRRLACVSARTITWGSDMDRTAVGRRFAGAVGCLDVRRAGGAVSQLVAGARHTASERSDCVRQGKEEEEERRRTRPNATHTDVKTAERVRVCCERFVWLRLLGPCPCTSAPIDPSSRWAPIRGRDRAGKGKGGYRAHAPRTKAIAKRKRASKRTNESNSERWRKTANNGMSDEENERETHHCGGTNVDVGSERRRRATNGGNRTDGLTDWGPHVALSTSNTANSDSASNSNRERASSRHQLSTRSGRNAQLTNG
jgi:hypothetical protein